MKHVIAFLKWTLILVLILVTLIAVAGFIKFNLIANDVYNEQGERM